MEAVNLLLSKRDVIEFAEENHSIVVYEYLDEDTIKLFLIKRNVVCTASDALWSQQWKLNR